MENKKNMRNTTIYMVMSLAGMAFCITMGWMTGAEMGAVSGMMGGIICLIPTIQLILQAKQKGFLPFYWNLEEENGMKKEKYCIVPNKFGKLRIIVAKMVSDGVIFIKRFGLIDDKGTEYTFGNSPLCFVLPGLGFTKNIPSSQYHHLLKKEKDINDWDEAVKKYLGAEKYKEFCKSFRVKSEPDSNDIQAELQYLKDVRYPADPLALKICGETVTFHNDIDFMKYNYHPQVMKVFVENEKMNVKLREQGYKDPGKAMSYAKAAAVILIVVMVVIIALASVDLSQLGSFFGGGSKAAAPIVNGTVHP
jgi:hypothetical protein